jgi:two-component system, NarL family, response regulator DevR
MGGRTDRITIVIADDHRAFGEALQVALGNEPDLEVLAVLTDGEAVVEMASTETPDVALIDLQMPGVDGLEASRRIRRSSPETAVVILTGTEDRLAIGRAVQAGAHGFLRKTEAVTDLAEAVRRAHRGEALNRSDEIEVALRRLRRRRDADGDMARRLERLTPREVEVLQLLADGLPSDRIADELDLSKHTLRTHVQNILTKLGVHSKLEAIVVAIRFGTVRTADVVDLGEIPGPAPETRGERGA